MNRTWKIVVASATIIVGASVGNSWERIPASSVIPSVLVSSADEQKILLGNGESGYALSYDGGANWEIVNPWLPEGINRYDDAFTIDAEADTIFLSGANVLHDSLRFCYTFNGGITWNRYIADWVEDGLYVYLPRRMTFDGRNHNRIWYINPVYLLRTEDGARTWEKIPIDSVSYTISSFFQDPDDDSRLWASGIVLDNELINNPLNRLIRRSDDRGEHWASTLNYSSISDLDYSQIVTTDMIKLSNGHLLLSLRATRDGEADLVNGLFMSEDDGVTGTFYSGNLPFGFIPTRLVETANFPGTVLVIGSSAKGVYRSTDYGVTFNRCEEGLPDGATQIMELSSNPFSHLIYVSIRDWGIYSTSDGGITWEHIQRPETGTRMHFKVFPEQIVQTGDGYMLQQFFFESGETTTFSIPVINSELFQPYPVVFADGSTIVTGVQIIDVEGESVSWSTIKSDDLGQSWEELADRMPYRTTHYRSWQGEDEARLYTLCHSESGVRFFVSTDTAHTWTEGGSIPGSSSGVYDFKNRDTTLYIRQFHHGISRIFRSNNDGLEWEDLNFQDGFAMHYPLDSERLIVAVYLDQDSYKIYTYIDDQWRIVQHDLQVNGTFILVPGSRERVVTTYTNHNAETDLLISEDMGETWIRRPLTIPYAEYHPFIGSLQYDPWRDRVWLSTGVGLCWMPASELAVGEGPITPIPLDHDMITNYPNPFNDQTRIRYTLAKPGEIKVELYDLQGRLVRTLEEGHKSAGQHDIALVSNGMASGTYFLRLTSPGDVTTTRLTLVK